MIRQRFQGYRCKSGIVIFTCRIAWNYKYSHFNCLIISLVTFRRTSLIYVTYIWNCLILLKPGVLSSIINDILSRLKPRNLSNFRDWSLTNKYTMSGTVDSSLRFEYLGCKLSLLGYLYIRMYTVQCTPPKSYVYCIALSRILQSWPSTLYATKVLQCTVYSVYSVQCTVYSVQCTVLHIFFRDVL